MPRTMNSLIITWRFISTITHHHLNICAIAVGYPANHNYRLRGKDDGHPATTLHFRWTVRSDRISLGIQSMLSRWTYVLFSAFYTMHHIIFYALFSGLSYLLLLAMPFIKPSRINSSTMYSSFADVTSSQLSWPARYTSFACIRIAKS